MSHDHRSLAERLRPGHVLILVGALMVLYGIGAFAGMVPSP